METIQRAVRCETSPAGLVAFALLAVPYPAANGEDDHPEITARSESASQNAGCGTLRSGPSTRLRVIMPEARTTVLHAATGVPHRPSQEGT